MNKEEIKEAIEIIRKPITVNHKDYYYFDQENYNNLICAYENCQWFINNFEQLMINAKDLQQEVKQLEERLKRAAEYITKEIRPEYRNGRINEVYLELNEKKLKELLLILKGEEEK